MYFFVRLYAGDRIASFFLDAYLRPAEKRGGAWMDECLGTDVLCYVLEQFSNDCRKLLLDCDCWA